MKIKKIILLGCLILVTNSFCACNDLIKILYQHKYRNLSILTEATKVNLLCHNELGEIFCAVSGEGLYPQFELLLKLDTFNNFKNHQDQQNGNTALHKAVIYNHYRIVEEILQTYNFNDVVNNNGITAYEIAFHLKKTEIIKLFHKYQDLYIGRKTLEILKDINFNPLDAIRLYKQITFEKPAEVEEKVILQKFQKKLQKNKSKVMDREKKEFIELGQYKDINLLRSFINRHKNDIKNIGLILRKLCGEKGVPFYQHILLLTLLAMESEQRRPVVSG